jgi:biopolymer transport protein ExbD
MRRVFHAGETVPNLAPMVDVIMVLLVFFLLGASVELADQGILQTELDPSSGPGEGVAVEIHPSVRIALEDVGAGASVRIYANDAFVGEDDFDALFQLLVQRLKAGADPANPVIIGAKQTVRWKYVIAAMDAAVQAKFKNIQFAVSFRTGSFGSTP